jgi:tRNA (guanine37-N1)-methyltransferase
MSHFHAAILTSFPEMFPGTLGMSLAGTALKNDIWSYEAINIRDFGLTRHKNMDDEPFGGGNGMVIRPDVLGDAIDFALDKNPDAQICYMSPRGTVLKQHHLKKIVAHKNIIVICGRFEGIDERVIEEYNIQEISIGDFVLSGGELAAMVMLDACIRLIPGVLKNQDTLSEESFCKIGKREVLLEYPLYTRPAVWREREVPKVLTSGNHQKIAAWRLQKSREITAQRRPDLVKPSFF